MLQKKRELLQDKLAVLEDKMQGIRTQIEETRASLSLVRKIAELQTGTLVKFYTGTKVVQTGIVLGVDAERERIRVFQGEGLDSKAVTIRAEHILEVITAYATGGGVATPSSESGSRPVSEAPPQGGSYIKVEPIRIQ